MISAVVVAAGKGERFGAPKQWMLLGGKPLLWWSALGFGRHPRVDEVVLVVREEDLGRARQLNLPKVEKIVHGGKTRSESVLNGVKAAAGEWVLVHDGARPLLSESLISRVIEALGKHSSVIPALRVADTVVRPDGTPVPREGLLRVQTPQGFWREKLLEAFERAEGSFTDEGTLLKEVLGISPFFVQGEEANLKITYPEDLALAERLLPVRVGFGWDAHPFEEGRPLTLGGVEIPYEKGLSGHSDADVLTHAVIDALLGAASLGNIGQLFPDDDPAYKGARSIELLRRVAELLRERGLSVQQVDCTLILAKPKLGPKLAEIERSLSEAVGAPVSVKPKSGNGLGFAGRGEGAEAYAVAVVRG